MESKDKVASKETEVAIKETKMAVKSRAEREIELISLGMGGATKPEKFVTKSAALAAFLICNEVKFFGLAAFRQPGFVLEGNPLNIVKLHILFQQAVEDSVPSVTQFLQTLDHLRALLDDATYVNESEHGPGRTS